MSSQYTRSLEGMTLFRVKQLTQYVEELASTSKSPDLQVAYMLTSLNGREIAAAVNKPESKELHGTKRIPNLLHAEKQLTLEVTRNHVERGEFYAIGNYSPCRYCVADLRSIGVVAIIFQNLYWDTPALEFAEKLGMSLLYFSGRELHVLSHSVIMTLSELNIAPLDRRNRENKPTQDRDSVKSLYVRAHKESLTELLNMLLIELLSRCQRMDDLSTKVKISRIVSQIDTEQRCLSWAMKNVLLAKQPW